ncbi:Tetratricopeptide repeat protein 1 like [Verticillium longisporum]|uniref:Tetratricopeptide repeat protein 1 like n=1 Tax=Verticillium longisporum TaxID=100787 RepID=A0A8I3APH8_VERLO|nr:Tetratricopeptide repeat protein 1 like [Verticillium longisporum]
MTIRSLSSFSRQQQEGHSEMAATEEKAKAAADREEKNIENDGQETEAVEKFPPEEEAALLAESNTSKTEANSLFASSKYEAAITKYDEAVATCPNYLDYELAVLRSNIAACHLKLEQWKEAVSTATAALDGLDRIDKEEALRVDEAAKAKAAEDDVEEEIVSSGAGSAATAPIEEDEEDAKRRKRKEDVLRIRAKALMRRARARSEKGGWSDLSGAEEDYKLLAQMTNLAPADAKLVRTQLRLLPPRTKAAQEKETAEMWSKLKDLGNGILKPFGLSTENFQMVKDEKTGGYSMNFNQGAGK